MKRSKALLERAGEKLKPFFAGKLNTDILLKARRKSAHGGHRR